MNTVLSTNDWSESFIHPQNFGYPMISPKRYYCSLSCLEKEISELVEERGVVYSRRMANYVDGEPMSGRLICRYSGCPAFIRVVKTKRGYHMTSQGPAHSDKCLEDQELSLATHALNSEHEEQKPPQNSITEKLSEDRTEPRDETNMKAAIEMAKKALSSGETPVGCVVVDKNDKVIAEGANKTNQTKDPTQHAELLAVESLLEKTGDLSAIDKLYVTIEPCIMCASILLQARIPSVVFAAYNDRFGGMGGVLSLHSQKHCDRCCVRSLSDPEAVQLLRTFYETGNPNAPNPKRKP